MENIAVSLIVDGTFKNVVISKEMLGELAVKLREEGKYMVHLASGSVEAEGIVISAKGSKNALMVIPNIKE